MPEKAVKKVLSNADIYVSPELLIEYRGVPVSLEAVGKIDRKQFQALISGIASIVSKAKIVHPAKKISVCRGPEDNMVLECCKTACAEGRQATHADRSSPYDTRAGINPAPTFMQPVPINLNTKEEKIVTPGEFIKTK